MPLLRNKLQRPKALLCILRYGHHFFMNIDERQGLSIPSHYAVSHPHIIVCNIIFSDTETRLGIHNSRWLDFGVMKMESKSKKKKYFWKETVQHQNSEFTNCWLDKPLLPSEDVQWSSQFNFSSISLATLLHSRIWSMLILNFSEEIINFTSEIEILFGLTVALSVSWHCC